MHDHYIQAAVYMFYTKNSKHACLHPSAQCHAPGSATARALPQPCARPRSMRRRLARATRLCRPRALTLEPRRSAAPASIRPQ